MSALCTGKAKNIVFLAWFFIVSFLVIGGTAVWSATVSDDAVVDVTAVVGGNEPPGGSTSGSVQSASVILQGTAFPNAKLTLLKDGAVHTTLVVTSDGTFNLHINSLQFGNYQFSLYAQDSSGLESNPYTVNVNVSEVRAYVYSGILLPPTIKADQLVIALQQSFSVFGYAAPGATVKIDVPGVATLGNGTTDANGYYKITLTADLPAGLYQLRAIAQLNSIESLYSKPVQVLFYKGKPGEVLPPPPAQFGTCVDFNKDRRVNLIDFSILLYWFGKDTPPSSVDCNSDQQINIKDFSILMYFWTG